MRIRISVLGRNIIFKKAILRLRLLCVFEWAGVDFFILLAVTTGINYVEQIAFPFANWVRARVCVCGKN